MKKLICSLLTVLTAVSLFAQNENKGIHLGMNAARIIQMMGDHSNQEGINPYLLDLGYSTGILGFRASFGLDNNSSINQPSAGNAEIMTQRDSSKTDWRIGAYFPVAVHEKWQLNVGLDYYQSSSNRLLRTEFTNENGESVADENSADFKESGVSPYLAVQYRPHPKVSIGTELLMRFGKHQLTETSTNNLFPEFNTEVITDGNRNYFIAPSAIFICLTL